MKSFVCSGRSVLYAEHTAVLSLSFCVHLQAPKQSGVVIHGAKKFCQSEHKKAMLEVQFWKD